MQAADMTAMGHRITEMKYLLIQRELRMKSQLQEVYSQNQTMKAVLKNIQPLTENVVPTNSLQDVINPPHKSSRKNVTLKSKEKLTTLKTSQRRSYFHPSTNKTL